MDILSYILGKKNSGSNTGGSGGTGGSGSSNASVFVKGGGAVVDPAQIYSRLYFNTELSNKEIEALMNNLELNYQGVANVLYATDGTVIMAFVAIDVGGYVLMQMFADADGRILFAINGSSFDETITFTGWNPDIDFSNGIEISGSTTSTEFPTYDGPAPIGANNDKIAELFSSEPIKKSVNKGLSGVYDGNNIEVGSTHIDISSLLDENKLPLNIDVVDSNLTPRNIVEGVNILGVEGTYSAHGLENELVDRTLTTYTNNSVTSVGDYAFYEHKNLTAVNFSNVTNIGQYAFNGCDNLTSVKFPKATNIGNSAFDYCSSLTNADFPEASYLGDRVFRECRSLTSINFPKVTDIKDYTFNNCVNLTNADFPEAAGIDIHAFSGCNSLTNVYFPKAISIGNSAFYYCNKLVSVNLPSATDIRDSAFNHCSSLISVDFPKAAYLKKNTFIDCSSLTNVNIPDATDIEDYAFCRCSSLTEINLPKAIYLRDRVFKDCTSLINANFPEVSYLGYSVFRDCINLTSVELSKVTSIRDAAFENCYSLNKVFIAQAEQICTLGQSVFSNCYHILGTTNSTYNPNGLKDGYIYVPASLLSQYKIATNWSKHAAQIIGHEDLEAGAALPDHTTTDFTTQTWYSDEKLTTIVTEVITTGKYYCRLEA